MTARRNYERTPLPPRTPLKNETYMVHRVLGEGGFAITYQGDDTRGPVAIKELFPRGCRRQGLSVIPSSQERRRWVKVVNGFIREANLLASLRGQPGLVYVSDQFRENGTAYMVMEFIEGDSLEKVRNVEPRLDPKKVLSWISDVGSILARCHAVGVLHLDIKPANIIVDKYNQLRVIDFGSARKYSVAAPREKYVSASEYYAAPELITRMALGPGTYSDVYSLAATCYVLLTRMPHKLAGDDPWERLSMLSENSVAALKRALEPDPSKRTSNMASFVDELTDAPSIRPATNLPSNALSPQGIYITETERMRVQDGPVIDLGEEAEFIADDFQSTGYGGTLPPKDPVVVVDRDKAHTGTATPEQPRRERFTALIGTLALALMLIFLGALASEFRKDWVPPVATPGSDLTRPIATVTPDPGADSGFFYMEVAFSILVLLGLLTAAGLLLVRRLGEPSLTGLRLESDSGKTRVLRGPKNTISEAGATLRLRPAQPPNHLLLTVLSSSVPIRIDGVERQPGERTELTSGAVLQIGGQWYILRGEPRWSQGLRQSSRNEDPY